MYSTRKTLPHDPAEILGELSGAVLDIRDNALQRDVLNVPAEQFVYELKETLAVREVALSYQLGKFGVAADGAGRIHSALAVEAEHVLEVLDGHACGVQQTVIRTLHFSDVAGQHRIPFGARVERGSLNQIVVGENAEVRQIREEIAVLRRRFHAVLRASAVVYERVACVGLHGAEVVPGIQPVPLLGGKLVGRLGVVNAEGFLVFQRLFDRVE